MMFDAIVKFVFKSATVSQLNCLNFIDVNACLLLVWSHKNVRLQLLTCACGILKNPGLKTFLCESDFFLYYRPSLDQFFSTQ